MEKALLQLITLSTCPHVPSLPMTYNPPNRRQLLTPLTLFQKLTSLPLPISNPQTCLKLMLISHRLHQDQQKGIAVPHIRLHNEKGSLPWNFS